MTSVLSKIVEQKKSEVEALYAKYHSLEGFSIRPVKNNPFYTAIKKPGLSLIAEIKKGSPSKGIIRHNFDPKFLAKSFEATGASALSVLTDQQFFMGHNDNIALASSVSTLPVLRKEFIIDPIQIAEAVSIGASAILLIASILTRDQLVNLHKIAVTYGLAVLVEIHSDEEIEKISDIKDLLIVGINNRNLNSFETDVTFALTKYDRLRELVSDKGAVVAESGYDNASQLDVISNVGFDAVLIGEGLATHPELGYYFR